MSDETPRVYLDLHLSKARHLFDIDGVAIVLGVNRAELGHAVEARHGPECDVDGHLRRFADLSRGRPPVKWWA